MDTFKVTAKPHAMKYGDFKNAHNKTMVTDDGYMLEGAIGIKVWVPKDFFEANFTKATKTESKKKVD